MKGTLEIEGNFELFETTHGQLILELNDKDWYAIVNGQHGHIMVKTDLDHEKRRTLHKGKFHMADVEGDPEFRDMPHLLIKEGEEYREYILPSNFPADDSKKVLKTDHALSGKKIEKPIKGEGESEKKNMDRKASTGREKRKDIKSISKKELNQLAKERNIQSYSKMNKKELIEKLKNK